MKIDKKPTRWIQVALISTAIFVVLFIANQRNDVIALNKVHSGYQIETLIHNKTPYVGDNSKVVALIDAMPLPAGVVRDKVELQTSTKPYGITINYTVNDEKDMGGTFYFRNAIMLLSLVDNVDVIYGEVLYADKNSASNTTAKYPYTREMAEKLMGVDVRLYANNTDTLNTLIDRLNSIYE